MTHGVVGSEHATSLHEGVGRTGHARATRSRGPRRAALVGSLAVACIGAVAGVLVIVHGGVDVDGAGFIPAAEHAVAVRADDGDSGDVVHPFDVTLQGHELGSPSIVDAIGATGGSSPAGQPTGTTSTARGSAVPAHNPTPTRGSGATAPTPVPTSSSNAGSNGASQHPTPTPTPTPTPGGGGNGSAHAPTPDPTPTPTPTAPITPNPPPVTTPTIPVTPGGTITVPPIGGIVVPPITLPPVVLPRVPVGGLLAGALGGVATTLGGATNATNGLVGGLATTLGGPTGQRRGPATTPARLLP